MARKSLFERYSVNDETVADHALSEDEKRLKTEDQLADFEESALAVINTVLEHSDFKRKYEVSGTDPFIYLFTQRLHEFTFAAELFTVASLTDLQSRTSSVLQCLTFHSAFEDVIERYTNDRRKPNQVLLEVRPSSFAHQLVVKFEAVPIELPIYAETYLLLREFKAIQTLWENYRAELIARRCNADLLVGFPMPFEFKNVAGSSAYDFPKMERDRYVYYDLQGQVQKFYMQPVSTFGFGTTSKSVVSSLSYMSVEKLGPSLPYLVDLVHSQGHMFTLSSALKIYDQLICRLMIFHKYGGMAHGDINPECLTFGCQEASSVLYISNFEKAVKCTSQSSPLPLFNDRFVSHVQVREKKCHFMSDLESAFYVFLFMLVGRLPWDCRLVGTASTVSSRMKPDAPVRKTLTIDLKEKFWSRQSIHSITNFVEQEHSNSLYCNFSLDIIETIFARMKDSMASCFIMSPESFIQEIFLTGSAAYNCYFGVRRVIVSYFNFESLGQMMRDTVCTSKLEILAKAEPSDRRLLWDLSSWCWNHLYIDTVRK